MTKISHLGSWFDPKAWEVSGCIHQVRVQLASHGQWSGHRWRRGREAAPWPSKAVHGVALASLGSQFQTLPRQYADTSSSEWASNGTGRLEPQRAPPWTRQLTTSRHSSLQIGHHQPPVTLQHVQFRSLVRCSGNRRTQEHQVSDAGDAASVEEDVTPCALQHRSRGWRRQ